MWLGGEDHRTARPSSSHADEGLGDTIQFARYVPMLAERGARVILVVQDPLHRLLSGLSGVSQCVPMSAASTLPAFDLHCPVSQPAAGLRNPSRYHSVGDIVSAFPGAKPACRRGKIASALVTRFRVGLVWSGSPANTNDLNRSMSLRTLSRILDVDATFISLQKDPRPE